MCLVDIAKVVSRGYANWHPHQQLLRVPVASHSLQLSATAGVPSLLRVYGMLLYLVGIVPLDDYFFRGFFFFFFLVLLVCFSI